MMHRTLINTLLTIGLLQYKRGTPFLLFIARNLTEEKIVTDATYKNCTILTNVLNFLLTRYLYHFNLRYMSMIQYNYTSKLN